MKTKFKCELPLCAYIIKYFYVEIQLQLVIMQTFPGITILNIYCHGFLLCVQTKCLFMTYHILSNLWNVLIIGTSNFNYLFRSNSRNK